MRDAVLLRSTHNVVLWLRPADVVAKIGVGRNANLRLELEVVLQLAAQGAPVVCPAAHVPAAVHWCNHVDLTFWRHHAQDRAPEIDSRKVSAALGRLHAALAGLSPSLRARLPSYRCELDHARGLLADASATPALPARDRRLLADTFDGLAGLLAGLAPPATHIVLHGSPHSYNILQVDGEPRFIDFETACTGPAEWDVAFVEAGAESSYARPLDRRLLQVCRGMASVMTAAFCWSDVDRGDLREHALLHLENVRMNVAPLLNGNRATAW